MSFKVGMAMTNYKIMLFDLDGTLTDPKSGITRSVQYALKKMGILENDLNNLTKFIGPPLVESFQAYYEMDYEMAWQAVEYYREYFAEKGIFDNYVYPGIPELLQRLKEKKKVLGIATSKPTVFSEQILEYFKLDRYFSLVVGSNLDGSRVDKKDIIKAALESLPVKDYREAIMVGDRRHDIIGARENGIDSIGVMYGYGSRDEFEKSQATYIVETVAELEKLLSAG